MELTKSDIFLIQDTDFLLQKRVVTQKLQQLFAQLAGQIRESSVHQQFVFPDKTDKQTGKLSKGENYKGLPYLVLDFPRFFAKENIFTFRSMFWWGHEFSFTLHLGGIYATNYLPKVIDNLSILQQKNVYFCQYKNAWRYDFDNENYCPINLLDEQSIKKQVINFHFLKISRVLSLEKWTELPSFGLETYELFLGCLQE